MLHNRFAVAFAVTLLSFGTPAWSGTAAEDLSIIEPYARAVPPVVPNSAAFMTLHNSGAADHTLVSASSPAAAIVELHSHVNDNGVMRMRPVTGGIAVPAGGTVELQPGGLHVMLIGLHQPLSEGQTVELELVFEDASRQTVSTPVRKIAAGGMDHQHQH